MSDSDDDEEQPVAHSKVRAKKGTIVSDDDEEEDASVSRTKSKGKGKQVIKEEDEDLYAMMDVDDGMFLQSTP